MKQNKKCLKKFQNNLLNIYIVNYTNKYFFTKKCDVTYLNVK